MIRILRWTSVAALCAIVSAAALAADYEERRFPDGPAWYLFDGPVETALYVPNPNAPKCHEIGEIILLFENRDQLVDDALIHESALAGMTHYRDICQSLGQKGSHQRAVVGFVYRDGEPDSKGRILGELRVFDAIVTNLGAPPGEYRVVVRYNPAASQLQQTKAEQDAAAQRAELNRQIEETKQQREEALKQEEVRREVEIEDLRTTYDTALEKSLAIAQPPGLIGRMTGGTRASLTGAWSASRTNCENEVLVLYEGDSAGTVEWWRQDSKKHGLLPWRTGRWDLRDGTLIMSFDHRVEYSRLVGKVQAGSINETAQFDLVKAEDTELRLAATGGSLSPGFLFLGGEEKLFVRCNG